MISPPAITGYAEGYYGRLLSWYERAILLDTLNETRGNFYLYAPKDDDYHRLNWRTPYPDDWRDNFRAFTAKAKSINPCIDVAAGLSPGLDFDFSHLNDEPEGRSDFQALCDKALQLLSDGASAIVLMFDDIDADFEKRRGSFNDEGTAHAELANRLYTAVRNFRDKHRETADQTQYSQTLCYAVPRIYANELVEGNDSSLISVGLQKQNGRYLHTFLDNLDAEIKWFYCGESIIAKEPSIKNLKSLLQAEASHLFATCESTNDSDKSSYLPTSTHRVIFWDNYYANDYCPRRLYLGPWLGREHCANVVINPTGLIHTDQLLLRIVNACRNLELSDRERHDRWYQCLVEAQVPEAFQHIKHYFYAPTFSDDAKYADDDQTANRIEPVTNTERQVELNAVEQLLWRWKSPLAREWYPYLLGLKHDLQLANGELSELRIRKTQTSPLATHLTRSPSTDADEHQE